MTPSYDFSVEQVLFDVVSVAGIVLTVVVAVFAVNKIKSLFHDVEYPLSSIYESDGTRFDELTGEYVSDGEWKKRNKKYREAIWK